MIPGLARVEMDEKWVGRGGEEIEMTPRFGDQVTQMDRGSGFSERLEEEKVWLQRGTCSLKCLFIPRESPSVYLHKKGPPH